MSTTYAGVHDRFKNEVAENTRKTKEALCSIAKQYNTNEMFVLQDTNTITLPANTYHSYTFTIVNGSADITESGVTASSINKGYTGESTASSLLINPLTITGLSSGTLVVIKTLR